MTKMTKREMFLAIAAYLAVAPALMDATPEGMDPEDFMEAAVNAMNHEVALIDRKRTAPKAPTAEQVKNLAYKADIVDFLGTVPEATATEVSKALGVNVQKATALLRQLVLVNAVTRVEKGKKVVFTRNAV